MWFIFLHFLCCDFSTNICFSIQCMRLFSKWIRCRVARFTGTAKKLDLVMPRSSGLSHIQMRIRNMMMMLPCIQMRLEWPQPLRDSTDWTIFVILWSYFRDYLGHHRPCFIIKQLCIDTSARLLLEPWSSYYVPTYNANIWQCRGHGR